MRNETTPPHPLLRQDPKRSDLSAYAKPFVSIGGNFANVGILDLCAILTRE